MNESICHSRVSGSFLFLSSKNYSYVSIKQNSVDPE